MKKYNMRTAELKCGDYDTWSKMKSDDGEMEVFVSIVYKYHSMKDNSMLLGELGAQFSHSQRHLIRKQGRLLSWLSQFPIFTVSSNSYAECVTFNNGGSEKRLDFDGKSKVLELTETRVRSVSEADVVALEDFVDTVLEHIAEMVEEVSSLRRLVFEVSSCNLIACF